jgi:hypothetical protein
MTPQDFADHHIKYFTPTEITDTGAALEDVQAALIVRYDYFRKLLGRAVCFCPNGLTTGNHKSPLHPAGEAGDASFREKDGPVNVTNVVKAALQAGFRGIGVYYNGTAYSIHLDLRSEYGFWTGFKGHRESTWNFRSLIVDPATL